MENVRVLIVDDEVLVRQGIASILRESSWIEVVAEIGDTTTLLKQIQHLRPDVVLLKAELVRADANQTMRSIRLASPSSRFILVLSSESDHQAAVQASVHAGARAVLSRSVDSDDFLACIRIVAKGGVVLAVSTAGAMFDGLWDSLETKQNAKKSVWHNRAVPRALADTELTEREFEVLTLLAEGSRNREIAELLCISENTAKTHVRNILEKLQLQSRTHAAAYAIRRGFVRKEGDDDEEEVVAG